MIGRWLSPRRRVADEVVTPSCPECGSTIAYDVTCHTYGTGDRWYSCVGCCSAIEYFCGAWLSDTIPSNCGWSYTDGLNPGNPRASANEAKRPAWLAGHRLIEAGAPRPLPGIPRLEDYEPPELGDRDAAPTAPHNAP